MRITSQQDTTKTLTDLYRAIDHQHAVTITYTDQAGVTTIRTIEIHDIRTTAEGIEIVAMCRLRAVERSFNLDQISAYTVHRMAYVLERPEPTTYVRTTAPIDDAQALFFYELARDQDDADYRPRRKLTQSQTDLAA